MAKVIIKDWKVREGNAQTSSDYIAAGVDSIIKGLNLNLHWRTRVRVRDDHANIMLELEGEDAVTAASMIHWMFSFADIVDDSFDGETITGSDATK